MLIADHISHVFYYLKCRSSPRTCQTHLQEINECHVNDPLHIISWLMDCIFGG